MSSASIVLLNQKSEIQRLSQFVERFGEAHRLSTDETLDINLILDEIVINIIVHGCDDAREHEIQVRLALDADTLTIQVADDGVPFNPVDAPPPDLDLPIEERPIGGLGIHIVRSLVDTIEHRRDDGRNVLTMTKKMNGAGVK
jgi:anti-sigma regulatory factor (Ser/Thr protein kinase)